MARYIYPEDSATICTLLYIVQYTVYSLQSTPLEETPSIIPSSIAAQGYDSLRRHTFIRKLIIGSTMAHKKNSKAGYDPEMSVLQVQQRHDSILPHNRTLSLISMLSQNLPNIREPTWMHIHIFMVTFLFDIRPAQVD